MKRWGWAGLAAILVFDVWWRCHTIGPTVRELTGRKLWPVVGLASEPLDCDEAAYGYMGRRIVRGDALYRDLTENKPPGGYWIYALAVAIGGPNELTIRLMPIPLVLATLGLVWWIGLRLGGPGTACLAAAIGAVATTDPYLFGNGANLEHAMNLFGVGSLALLIASWDRPGRAPIVAAGLLLGAECLVKQVAFTHGIVYALALLARRGPVGGERRTLRARWGDVLALALGFAVVWCAAIGVLAAQGALGAAYDDVIRYGSALATDTPPEPYAPPAWKRWLTGNADPAGGLPWPFGRTDYLVWWGTGTWPLWLAAVPALGWLLFGPRASAPRRLVAVWTISAWAQVGMPGLFWPHYYLLPVPGLALAVAVFFTDLAGGREASRETGRRAGMVRRLAACVVGLALVWTTVIQVRDYLLVAPEELTIRYKGGRQWVMLRLLGRDIARRSKIWPDPRMYVWGWQSPLLFYSGLDSVSRHFFADPLLKAYAGTNHRLIRRRVEEIMHDLRARPPEVIVLGDPPFPALNEFLAKGYRLSHVIGAAPDGRGMAVEKGKFAEFEGMDLR